MLLVVWCLLRPALLDETKKGRKEGRKEGKEKHAHRAGYLDLDMPIDQRRLLAARCGRRRRGWLISRGFVGSVDGGWCGFGGERRGGR